MATTDASVGTSCGLNANAASRPRQTYTVSPAPAPTASTATTAGPFGSRRTSRSVRPSSDGSFTVDTTRPITLPRYISVHRLLILCDLINNPDDCRIDGRVFTTLCHARRASLHNDDPFAKPRMDGIDSYHVTFLIIAVGIDQSANEQLFPFEPRIFPRGNDGPDNPGEHHGRCYLDVFPMGRTSSRLEWGLGITWTLMSSPTR